jgi:hypothetical protein
LAARDERTIESPNLASQKTGDGQHVGREGNIRI